MVIYPSGLALHIFFKPGGNVAHLRIKHALSDYLNLIGFRVSIILNIPTHVIPAAGDRASFPW